MTKTSVKDRTLEDTDLLKHVVDFKDKFYRCPWHIDALGTYDLAKCGTMCLMPPEYNIEKLHADYDHMQNMIFGEKQSFEDILQGIEQLEKEMKSNTYR